MALELTLAEDLIVDLPAEAYSVRPTEMGTAGVINVINTLGSALTIVTTVAFSVDLFRGILKTWLHRQDEEVRIHCRRGQDEILIKLDPKLARAMADEIAGLVSSFAGDDPH